MYVTKIESLQIENREHEDMLLDVADRLGYLVERVVTWSYSDGTFATNVYNAYTGEWVKL